MLNDVLSFAYTFTGCSLVVFVFIFVISLSVLGEFSAFANTILGMFWIPVLFLLDVFYTSSLFPPFPFPPMFSLKTVIYVTRTLGSVSFRH